MPSHIPELIEPSPIVIEQLDTGNTVYDALAREPIKSVARTAAVTLTAQVAWGRSAKYAHRAGGQGGLNSEARGYLVFKTSDLDDAGVTLARGDKVVTIGGRPADVYLTERTYGAHHYGEPHLEFWDFHDEAPKRRRS